MFNWLKRLGNRNSGESSWDQIDGYKERQLKKLRSAAPSKLYDMVTNISENPDLAEQALSMGKRIDAAIALQYKPSPETSEVLQSVIAHDPEYLVRYHATNSLLLIHGYQHPEKHQHIRELAPKLGNKKPTASPEALEAIQQLIRNHPIISASDIKW
jgi:hypothetical protein